MTYSVLNMLAELVTAAAGVAIGLCVLIVTIYWRVYRTVSNGARLLPLHIVGIGTSYAMLAAVVVLMMGDPPPPTAATWWVYPWVAVAYLIGDAALLLILRFVARRGPRYRAHGERRA